MVRGYFGAAAVIPARPSPQPDTQYEAGPETRITYAQRAGAVSFSNGKVAKDGQAKRQS
jgi:hypothetical protein